MAVTDTLTHTHIHTHTHTLMPHLTTYARIFDECTCDIHFEAKQIRLKSTGYSSFVRWTLESLLNESRVRFNE